MVVVLMGWSMAQKLSGKEGRGTVFGWWFQMIPGAGTGRNPRAGNCFQPGTFIVTMAAGAIFLGRDLRARVEWVKQGTQHTKLKKVPLRLCKICPSINASASLNFVSWVPRSAYPGSKGGRGSCCFCCTPGRGLVRSAGWEKGCRLQLLNPIIVHIGTKSYTIILLPEAPVHAHLYVTCMDPTFVSTGDRDGWKALPISSFLWMMRSWGISFAWYSCKASERSQLLCRRVKIESWNILLEQTFKYTLLMLFVYFCFKDLVYGAPSCSRGNLSLISRHSSPKLRCLSRLLSWCVPQLLNF